MSMSVRALLAVLACAALFLGACGGDDEESSGDGAASSDGGGGGGEIVEQPFLLSSSFGIYFLPIQIAHDQGYFEDEGIRVEVQETDGSSFVTQQVIAGNAEFGVAGAPTDIIAYEKDQDIRALSCIESQSIFSIYVPADSDIQDVTQLDGKKLGINERGGGEEPMVTAVIAENDLDTEVVPVGQETASIVRALQSGAVAAFSSSIGTRTSIEAEIELRDITPEKYRATPGDCLITKKSVIEEKPEVAAGLARAMLKGIYFAFANREAALDIGCKIAPEQCQGQQGYAEALADKMMELMQPSDPSGVPSQIEPPGWELSRDLLVQTGTLEDIDITDLIASPEVKQVEEAAFADVETLKAEAEEDAANYQAE
jgi:NitT/TauT family transport system substrate-binding protein